MYLCTVPRELAEEFVYLSRGRGGSLQIHKFTNTQITIFLPSRTRKILRLPHHWCRRKFDNKPQRLCRQFLSLTASLDGCADYFYMPPKKKGGTTAKATATKVLGKNWSEEEQMHLLEVMAEVIPINPDDWDRVKLKHDAAYAAFDRPVSSLLRQYGDLTRVVEPTGDPNIPRLVKKAKEVKELIHEKTDGTTGSPDGHELLNLSLEDEDENGDDEDDDDEDDDDDNEIQVINKNAAGRGNIGGVDEDELADSFFVNDAHDRVPSSLSISSTSTKTKRKKSAGRGGSKAKSAFNRRTAASRVVPMTSPKFTTQLMSMKQAAAAARVPAKKTISEEGFTFSNMMGMMMMMN